MRPLILLSFFALVSCDQHSKQSTQVPSGGLPAPDGPAAEEAEETDLTLSVVRVNSTRQSWNPSQPWEKKKPGKRRSLGAIVGESQVLTTAEMVTDHTFLELESSDGKLRAPATVLAVDYESNLALLTLSDPEADASFFAASVPLDLAEPIGAGGQLDILQIEDNGMPLTTAGTIQSIDILSNFLPGEYSLTYEVKASMQSAASSFSLPVLEDGKLAGLLTSYNSKDQICHVTPSEIVSRFIREASDGHYDGLPSLGVSITPTDDRNFRAWLKIPEDKGGLYVSSIRKGSAAEKADIRKSDVILAVEGNEIDRLGYFEHPLYGRLYWTHILRGAKNAGDTITLSLLRDGEALELEAVLERLEPMDRIVPPYTFGIQPNYLVKGGLVFQELTRPLLQSFGEEWKSRAPLNLLDALENPEKYEEKMDRVVFLAGVIATPATVGYEPLRNVIVTAVNGTPITEMKSLVDAFDKVPDDGLHSIRFEDEELTVFLDEVISTAVDEQLIQRGLHRLSNTGE